MLVWFHAEVVVMPVEGAPNAIESFFSNPGSQCTLFPFLGALTDSDVACWDLW